ncbi:hypothetical protein [Jeotgalibacillus proteolyticus]|uniref:Uncharacterized protein n=1 Tax=Jeotgalibacillus proteolyticus TaxID=2082395 RepID=A0A2S5GAY5_9BACL|nr:hypothetical protein [Jeotgalibacillus proteolyticus]PPA70150.1 hypothetical protein C4B60_11215 [Jeotgalibacillus proteolyticus]
MKRLMNLTTVYIVAGIIAIGFLFIFPMIETLKARAQGVSYYTNNIENYHINSYPIEGEYTVDIDMNNLENNQGKVLFDDGENQVYVSKVIAQTEGGYELFFSPSATYRTGGATEVSGVAYSYSNNRLLNEFKADAKASYNDETIELKPSSFTPDEFSFYMEPQGDLSSEVQEEVIEVAVSNLYINYWTKK